MKQKPYILVQLVHFTGPLKGKIQEFSSTSVTLGRDPQCDVVFPKELLIVSRKHAHIEREGNRFKVIDHSANGTFVNGNRVNEAFLRHGDVLTIGEGGPKLSFQIQTVESRSDEQPTLVSEDQEQPLAPTSNQSTVPGPSSEPPGGVSQELDVPVSSPKPTRLEKISGGDIKRLLSIQYGHRLQAFETLPVVIGHSAECDFTIEHPAVLARHVEIHYNQNRYWVKDLTGRNLVTINKQPVQSRAPLIQGAPLALSPQGPDFQFLGEGRLAEIPVAGSAASGEPLSRRSERSRRTDPVPPKPPKARILFWVCLILVGSGILYLFGVRGLPTLFEKELKDLLNKLVEFAGGFIGN
jgi:pSer/pThr/pTyr-binding forkhead associated (FHA) protein